ncbi:MULTISPECIES: hypothetical protein [unclassified Paracoccus (in: a-proteobacteria)]|uniref:hypothetical protein n=1 Tax=unclassified Paracoccus (in: a-proteobacteria) TaxID=2688777 RepID=UPI001ADD5B9F|nr:MULTISPECIES: hypothetical protein [unclassified Paracoccus (in: a-proteobacteria)]MBO9456230.1 hypothetical protein [Paracoccus sp. R12_2]
MQERSAPRAERPADGDALRKRHQQDGDIFRADVALQVASRLKIPYRGNDAALKRGQKPAKHVAKRLIVHLQLAREQDRRQDVRLGCG